MSVAAASPAAAPPRFDGLRAVFINATLKPSPAPSNTDGLLRMSTRIMEELGVSVEVVRAVDHDIAVGLWPDMTEHGAETDDWPAIFDTVMAADILVLAGPIWLGDNSSVMKRVVERLYGCSGILNEAGQYAYYGRVGGCLITGNEDGIKHCAMNLLYSLQHLGYTVPPQADAGWIGPVGTGTVVPRPGLGRSRERLHQPQHHLHDLQPGAPRSHVARGRRDPGVRQPTQRVGRRLGSPPGQPRAPVDTARKGTP